MSDPFPVFVVFRGFSEPPPKERTLKDRIGTGTLSSRAELLRWTQLIVGLLGFGAAVALMIRSELGLGPWDAFHVGLHRATGISVGTASIAVGLLIVCASYWLGVRPGAGTLVNMVLIGVFIDLLLPVVAPATHWTWGVLYYLAGIGIAGVATGVYIGAGLGKGPRDGMVIGLSERVGWPVRRIRTLTEVAVLGLGWWMGGPIGAGTLLFTFTIGPAMQWGLELFDVDSATSRQGPLPR